MRDSPPMQRVFSMIAALADLLAERPEGEFHVLPRDVERLITYGLEIPIKRMLPLTFREAFRYLCILRGESFQPPVLSIVDRRLYGLLHIGPPCNIIFIRDRLSPQTHTYVLAHELGHFLADVFRVQQLWLRSLPEQKDAIERAFAWRECDARLELYAFIKGLPPRPREIMNRGQAISPETVEREIQADLFARELIAPWDVVSPLMQSHDKAQMVTLLYEKFQLPRRIAESYFEDLRRYLAPQPNVIAGLFAGLLASADKSRQ
ncbi:MAG TPA: ImmA/IrrE family metallo-endopeptidase [Blastocatellia bacterium]|nr:ImmA/IrrE family metallo-endopeptidase [Blastocatellia bacterium]